jgi:molybdopterin/thiamine biosynthesis adenylyltransferase
LKPKPLGLAYQKGGKMDSQLETTWKRLNRQLKIFSEDGIERILNTGLCIVGLGGNGNTFSLFAGYAGFRFFHLIDPQKLSLSNLNRFLAGGYEDVGRLKVEIVRDRLLAIDKNIQCWTYPHDVRHLSRKGVLQKADVIISCVDDDRARIYLQRKCLELKKPLLDMGSGGLIRNGKVRTLGSRSSFYIPEEACLFCQTLSENPAPHSRVSFITPNVIACALGLEVLLSWLTGYGDQVNFATYDCLKHELFSIKVNRKEDCKYCGQKAKKGAGK